MKFSDRARKAAELKYPMPERGLDAQSFTDLKRIGFMECYDENVVPAQAALHAAEEKIESLTQTAQSFLDIKDQREKDENEYAAGGMTYTIDDMQAAEKVLREELEKN